MGLRSSLIKEENLSEEEEEEEEAPEYYHTNFTDESLVRKRKRKAVGEEDERVRVCSSVNMKKKVDTSNLVIYFCKPYKSKTFSKNMYICKNPYFFHFLDN